VVGQLASAHEKKHAHGRSLPQKYIMEVAQRTREAELARHQVLAPVGQFFDAHPDSFVAAVNYLHTTHKAHEMYEAEVVEALTEYANLVRQKIAGEVTTTGR
jgi:hypothetical protein